MSIFDRVSELFSGLGGLLTGVALLGAGLFVYGALHHSPAEILAEGDMVRFEHLLKQNPSLAHKNSKHGTLLMQAVKAGSIEAVTCLVEAGADIEQVDGGGYNVLSYALGNPEMVLKLIEYGADPKHVERNGSSLLHIAVGIGNPFSVYALGMSGALLNGRDAENRAPIHLVRGEKIGLMNCLLELGAHPDIRNQVGETALHGAAIRDDYAAALALVNGNANLKVENWQTWSPLHLAAIHGSVGVMCLLLESGVEVDGRNEKGLTPMDCAIRKNNLDAIRALVGFGADLALQNEFGNTPLHSALSQGKYESAALLVSLGAPLDIKNSAKLTTRQLIADSENPLLIGALTADPVHSVAIK